MARLGGAEPGAAPAVAERVSQRFLRALGVNGRG
jgi:hypothetical protein